MPYYTDEERIARHKRLYGEEPDFPRKHKFWNNQEPKTGQEVQRIALPPPAHLPVIPPQPTPPAPPKSPALTGKQVFIIFAAAFGLGLYFYNQNKKG